MKKSQMIKCMVEFYNAISLLNLTQEEKMKALLDEQLKEGLVHPIHYIAEENIYTRNWEPEDQ